VTRDRGSIVLGWLARLTLTLAVLGLIGFELLSVAVTHVTVQDIGSQSADAAQTSFSQLQDIPRAYQAAEDYAESQGATIPRRSFQVNLDGSMRFEVRKTASTLVLHYIKPLATWAVVSYPVDVPPLEETGVSP
jgi:hypothetical protein